MPDWPPDGYSEPIQWEKDERGAAIVGVVLAIAVGYLVRFAIIQFLYIMRANIVGFIETLGIPRDSSLYVPLLVFGGGVLLYGLYVAYRDVIVPIHEHIHYRIADFFELNPEHSTEKLLFMENPGVICVTTDIPVWQSTVVTISPFLVVGLTSALVVVLIDGVIAGLAAFILVFNTLSSDGDIYTILRFSTLPNGTLFAHFKETENEYRSEYAIPDN